MTANCSGYRFDYSFNSCYLNYPNNLASSLLARVLFRGLLTSLSTLLCLLPHEVLDGGWSCGGHRCPWVMLGGVLLLGGCRVFWHWWGGSPGSSCGLYVRRIASFMPFCTPLHLRRSLARIFSIFSCLKCCRSLHQQLIEDQSLRAIAHNWREERLNKSSFRFCADWTALPDIFDAPCRSALASYRDENPCYEIAGRWPPDIGYALRANQAHLP